MIFYSYVKLPEAISYHKKPMIHTSKRSFSFPEIESPGATSSRTQDSNSLTFEASRRGSAHVSTLDQAMC